MTTSKKQTDVTNKTALEWSAFGWAAFLFWICSSKDTVYLALMNNTDLIRRIRKNITSLSVNVIEGQIIGFLNKYNCRLGNRARLAKHVKNAFRETEQHLNALQQFEIATINFNIASKEQGNEKTIKEIVEYLYDRFKGINGLGPTSTAKLLHVLQPELFVMWDDPILRNYQEKNAQVNDSPKGYYTFLTMMQELARKVNDAFHKTKSSLSIRVHQTSSDYLSDKLKYTPPKTLAKYLDEYNWITITKDIKLPSEWHPEKLLV